MFCWISKFIKSVNIYYQSAFNLYFISTILSIVGGLFLSSYILFESFNENKEILRLLLLNLFLIFMSLNLESINFSFLKDNKILRYLFICSVLIISGILVYNYVLIFNYSYMETSTILQYNVIILALAALFITFNLRFNFYSFFDFIGSAFFAFNVFILFAILFGISFLSIDFLFRFDFYLFDIYFACCVCIATILFIFFIGKVALLNHYLVITRESINEITSKRVNHLFLIFSIFSYFYASLLILYFALLFLGFIFPQYSAIHLIIWFSFFGITLFWLNQVLHSKYLGKFFLVLLFLLNIIALYSILIRIYEYGFTPSRYFVIISCIFLFVSVISSLFLRDYLKILFYLFVVLCMFSIFGSFNAIRVSVDSQLRALKSLEMNAENYTRISNIYRFLTHYINEDELADYRTFLNSQGENGYKYQNYKIPQVIDVYGFDTFITNISLNDETKRETKGGFDFSMQYDSLVISKNGSIIRVDNFYDFMKDAVESKGAGKIDTLGANKALTIEVNNGDNKARFYINRFGYDKEKKTINKIVFDVLLKVESKVDSRLEKE